MKIKHLLIVFLAGGLALASCNQTPKVPEGEFLIEGELKNVPDSVVVGLFKIVGRSGRSIAYDTIVGGKFSFRDTLSSVQPQKMLIDPSSYFNPHIKGLPSVSIEVWVASGKYVKVEGNDCLIQTWNVRSDIEEQKEVNHFYRAGMPELKEWLLCNAAQQDLRKLPRTEKNREQYRLLEHQRDSLMRIINLRKLAYMKEAPMSRVWLSEYSSFGTFYLMLKNDSVITPLVRELSVRMKEVDPKAEFYDEIMGYLNLPDKVNVGDDMADGDLIDREGNICHLSEFKGKYILLDFWNQGCGPCMQSFPEATEIASLYKNQLEVVGICLGNKTNQDMVVKEYKLTGNQWRQKAPGMSGLAAAYQVRGIPHYVMISPQGKVMDMWSGYRKDLLKEKMKELIK